MLVLAFGRLPGKLYLLLKLQLIDISKQLLMLHLEYGMEAYIDEELS